MVVVVSGLQRIELMSSVWVVVEKRTVPCLMLMINYNVGY